MANSPNWFSGDLQISWCLSGISAVCALEAESNFEGLAAVKGGRMLSGQPIRQIAYYTDNIRQAVERHHNLFGSGPFFLIENISLMVNHRGHDIEFRHDAAFGQWGSMQVEFMQPLTEGPSIIHDLYPAGSERQGIHHVALIIDDLESMTAAGEAAGFPVAMRAYLPEMDLKVVFLDSVERYGHFIELYQRVPSIVGFYEMVENASLDFDGSDILRSFRL